MSTLSTPANTPQPTAESTRVNLLERVRRSIGLQNIGLLIVLIVLVVFIGTQQGDKFFRPTNLLNIGLSVSLLGLVAIAQTIVMLSGGLDISIGS
ncbi:MAG: ABC transporter permease, partial [Anaerolineae bacterium]|nr:ABC transporter permease [Anaerolineae bacterium]